MNLYFDYTKMNPTLFIASDLIELIFIRTNYVCLVLYCKIRHSRSIIIYKNAMKSTIPHHVI